MNDQRFIQAIHDLIASFPLSENTRLNKTILSSNTQSNKTISASNIISHSKNCNDQNFPMVNWNGCDYSGAYLSHADLSDAELEGTDLSHSDLMKANILLVVGRSARCQSGRL